MKNIQKLLDNGVKPEEIFDWMDNLIEGFRCVALNNKFSFMDTNEKLISNGNLWFDDVDDFNEGFANVQLNNKWYKLNRNGILCDKDTKEPINPFINDTIVIEEEEEYTYVIPEGYYVIIKENKVIIKKIK